MSPSPLRIVLIALTLAMTVASVGLWSLYNAEPPLNAWDWTAIVWGPVSMAMLTAMCELAERKRAKAIAEKNLTILPSHVRDRRFSLFLIVSLVVMAQGMIVAKALHLIDGDAREVLARVLLAFTGVVLVLIGNQRAKTASPYRGGAAEPANWGRTQRRVGWGLVVSGLVLAVCVVVLPLEPVMVVALGVSVMFMAVSVAMRFMRGSAIR